MMLNQKGQQVVEYLVLVAIVIAIGLILVRPGGFMDTNVTDALETAMDQGFECAAAAACFQDGGCPSVCGDGCCERVRGEECDVCVADCGVCPTP